MTTAIYPGTFDPVTRGHLDVLKRACRLFDKVIIAVARNDYKNPFFPLDERVELIRENIVHFPNAEVDSFSGLLVEYARNKGAKALIRGMRAVSDFEFEFQMNHMNRHLDPELETLFLMPTEEFFYLSSSLIRQVSCFTDDITRFVPSNVAEALRKRFPNASKSHHAQ